MTRETTGLQPTKKVGIVLLLEEEHYLPQVLFHQMTENNMKEPSEVIELARLPRLTAVKKGGNTNNHQSYYSCGITQL